jgi:hypothetical protein
MTSKVPNDWFDRPIIHIRRSNDLFRRLLIGWVKAQEQYAEQLSYCDFAHYYSERPHVGFLAAGVWLSGGVALEEWKTEKSKERKKSYGRCDLWFSLVRDRPHHLEAKHRWLTFKGDERKIADRLCECMEDAIYAARKLRTGNEPRVAVLSVGFIAPKENRPPAPASILKKGFQLIGPKYCDAAAALIWKENRIKNGEAFGTAMLLRCLP